MTTIQIDKQSLIRACALAGIEHTIALRIMAYLPPIPGDVDNIAQPSALRRAAHALDWYDQKVIEDDLNRDSFHLFVLGLLGVGDEPQENIKVGWGNAVTGYAPQIGPDGVIKGFKPVDLTAGWPRPLETPAPRPHKGEDGAPEQPGSASQVSPGRALPPKRPPTWRPE